jgi:hypothetical protein
LNCGRFLRKTQFISEVHADGNGWNNTKSSNPKDYCDRPLISEFEGNYASKHKESGDAAAAN